MLALLISELEDCNDIDIYHFRTVSNIGNSNGCFFFCACEMETISYTHSRVSRNPTCLFVLNIRSFQNKLLFVCRLSVLCYTCVYAWLFPPFKVCVMLWLDTERNYSLFSSFIPKNLHLIYEKEWAMLHWLN